MGPPWDDAHQMVEIAPPHHEKELACRLDLLARKVLGDVAG
ncbi:MAG: hypothetical protein ACE5HK_02005 [Candidatus Methylomirabilales bacterium]